MSHMLLQVEYLVWFIVDKEELTTMVTGGTWVTFHKQLLLVHVSQAPINTYTNMGLDWVLQALIQ